jgi:preprotein translocase subunit YajC
MLINNAFAADTVPVNPVAPVATTGTETTMPVVPGAPSAMEAFLWNMGMVAVLVFLFYVLLISPQQRRFKEHTKLLAALKKGDRVVTGGGLVGVIEKIGDGDEVVIDLGHGSKVTALRSTLVGRDDPTKRTQAAANDKKK